mmetsp:Transcript_12094/g.35039  ORF Transcript_12094/g.35039 Transcript_12094/m.35039 type:complete len:253 (-) Transcript_12094:2541-3299(-)
MAEVAGIDLIIVQLQKRCQVPNVRAPPVTHIPMIMRQRLAGIHASRAVGCQTFCHAAQSIRLLVDAITCQRGSKEGIRQRCLTAVAIAERQFHHLQCSERPVFSLLVGVVLRVFCQLCQHGHGVDAFPVRHVRRVQQIFILLLANECANSIDVLGDVPLDILSRDVLPQLKQNEDNQIQSLAVFFLLDLEQNHALVGAHLILEAQCILQKNMDRGFRERVLPATILCSCEQQVHPESQFVKRLLPTNFWIQR